MTDEPLIDRLYRIAKLHGCTCVYKRQAGLPVYAQNQRVLEKRCARCEAVEEYERLYGE